MAAPRGEPGDPAASAKFGATCVTILPVSGDWLPAAKARLGDVDRSPVERAGVRPADQLEVRRNVGDGVGDRIQGSCWLCVPPWKARFGATWTILRPAGVKMRTTGQLEVRGRGRGVPERPHVGAARERQVRRGSEYDLRLEGDVGAADQLEVRADMRDPANHGPGVRTAEEGEVGCDVLRPAVEPEQVRATGQLEVRRRVGDDLGLQRGVGLPSEREVGRGVRSAQALEVRAPSSAKLGAT